jgi:hypothetical protein
MEDIFSFFIFDASPIQNTTMKHLFLLSFFISSLGASAQKIAVTDALSDLDYMIKKAEEVHFNPYLNIDENEFKIQKKTILKAWEGQDSIELREFILAGMKITALWDDAHTSIDMLSPVLVPQILAADYFPIQIKRNAEDELIVTASKDEKIKVGDKINIINDLSAHHLYDGAMSSYGGTESFMNDLCESILFPIYLFLKGVNAPYEIELSNGLVHQIKKGTSIQEVLQRLSPSGENYTCEILED